MGPGLLSEARKISEGSSKDVLGSCFESIMVEMSLKMNYLSSSHSNNSRAYNVCLRKSKVLVLCS